jgi:hypothetical protein
MSHRVSPPTAKGIPLLPQERTQASDRLEYPSSSSIFEYPLACLETFEDLASVGICWITMQKSALSPIREVTAFMVLCPVSRTYQQIP